MAEFIDKCRGCTLISWNDPLFDVNRCRNLCLIPKVRDFERLKCDLWAAHMARETMECPPGRRTEKCKDEWKICVPCWMWYAEEEKKV